MAAQLRFRILPETKDLILKNRSRIDEVSGERFRDEYFRLLGGPHQAAGILTSQQLGLNQRLVSGELKVDQLRVLRNLEDFWSIFRKTHSQESAANWFLGLLVHRLGRFRKDLNIYLKQDLVPGRSVYQHTFLAMLCRLAGGDKVLGKIQDNFPLSNQELDWLNKACLSIDQFAKLSSSSNGISPLDVYRYFRSFGSSGIGGVFLYLAEVSNNLPSDRREEWQTYLESARFILTGWWEKHQEWITPPQLLNGDDLQRELNIEPGPDLGILLEKLREAQVSQKVKSHQEGLIFLKNIIGKDD
jgi:tRNA nucleotidyltransferase/poly(A) polymerase